MSHFRIISEKPSLKFSCPSYFTYTNNLVPLEENEVENQITLIIEYAAYSMIKGIWFSSWFSTKESKLFV